MSVRKRKWRDVAGLECTAWVVDVQIVDKNGQVQRVRRVSRVQTRRAAEMSAATEKRGNLSSPD